MKPFGIVGIDPGTTAAYAVMDFDGRVVKVYSAKEFSLGYFIKEVTTVCFPLIVGTDKAKVPSFVEDFSRKTGAKIFSPEEDLRRDEKRLWCASFKNVCSVNGHVQDALSAAIFAYKKIYPKIVKMQRFLSVRKLEEKRELFLPLAIKEDFHFSLIEQMIKQPLFGREDVLLKSPESGNVNQSFHFDNDFHCKRKYDSLREENRRLSFSVNTMQEEFLLLKKENRHLEKKSQRFQQKLDRLLLFKEHRIKEQVLVIMKLQEEKKLIQEEMNLLYAFMGKMTSSRVLKKLVNLGSQAFSEAERFICLKDGDSLFVESPSIYSEHVLKALQEKNVIMISCAKFPALLKERFLTLQLFVSEILDNNDFFVLVDHSVLESKIKEKDLIMKIIKNYQQERKYEVRQERSL